MMVIHDVKFDNKYDQTPQNSSQELSMSYKHDCVLDALIIMLGSGKMNTTQELLIMLIHYVKCDIRDNPSLQNNCQKPPISSKYDWVLDALIILLGSWKLAHSSKMTHGGFLPVKFDKK